MTPYENLSAKYGVSFTFAPFYQIVPLSSIEMRAQHCNIADYSAVVFSSRSTIDAFFSLCEELRMKISEEMKYFCTNEKVAMYLQKHIVYRKRKIFFGDGTPSSVLDLITAKHKDDNFLIVTSDSPVSSLTKAFDTTSYKHKSVIFAKSVSKDLHDVAINDYDMIVVYNKADVAAIKENFPDFQQGDRAIIAYGGESLKKAVTEAGFTIGISAPTPECNSVVKAIDTYIQNNK
ncbi:MAG: uroporphyrinogen-III synthase [Bacteroidales bacterium]|nr:uroporphyrinogen-III synthase [Bacteroidales bacterium]